MQDIKSPEVIAPEDAADEDATDEEELKRQLGEMPDVDIISEDDQRAAKAVVDAINAKSASENDGAPDDDDGSEEGKAAVA